MLESKFKTTLIREIRERLPGAVVIHMNPPPQGIPDILILYGRHWGALEGKQATTSPHRPNQDYWVEQLNNMSFASFITPDTKKEVLNAMEQSFMA